MILDFIWTEKHAEILEGYIKLLDEHARLGTSDEAKDVISLMRAHLCTLRRRAGSSIHTLCADPR